MAFHGKGSRLLLGTAEFSGYLREFEAGEEIELGDSTTFGNEGHRFIAGLEQGTLSMGGLLDNVATAGGQDATLDGELKASAAAVITSAPGGLAVGARVSMIEAREGSYSISSPVADVVSFQASWQSEGQVDRGRVLATLAAVSGAAGDVDGTNIDNGALTSGGAAASLHVTSNTRNGTTTVKVQHSVDNSVWVDLITFAVVGAGLTASQRLTVAGTVNRHLRSKITKAGTTGSITLAVTAARR
jgi:hypothetical protein